jgi:hypothetical protein
VFKRASKDAAGVSNPSDPSGPGSGAAGLAGKGKATPKRREAEAARKTSVVAPARSGRSGRSGRARPPRQSSVEVRRQREAIRRGDESAMTVRDKGPVRRFVRDYVDARRNVLGLFIPLVAPLVVLIFTRVVVLILVAYASFYLFILAGVIDSLLMTRAIKKQVRIRFPGESTAGLGFYAVTRSMLFKRSRIPAPRVQRGAKV